MPVYPYRTYETLWGATFPTTYDGAALDINTRMRVEFSVAGYIVGLRYLRDLRHSTRSVGWIRSVPAGLIQRTVGFLNRLTGGSGIDRWETRYIRPRLKVAAGDKWDIGVFFNAGIYWYTPAKLATVDYVSGHMTLRNNASGVLNATLLGTYGNPTNTSGGAMYGIDLLFWVP